VYYTYLENPNKAWIATDGGGVAIIENDEPRVYKNNLLDSLSNKIYSIVPDLSGNIWFNLADNGLLMVDKQNKAIHINELNGLLSNTIQSVICDCNNQMVAFSNHGIDLLNIQSLLSDKFEEETGVHNLEPNLNAVYKDKNENIYFGTSKGIVKINKHKNDSLKPNLILTSKRLFLNEIDQDKTLFSHKENNITFSYAALWYKSSANLLYRYKLEGYDLDWSMETLTRMVTYPKLPHGKYKFMVQVKLSNGTWLGTQNSEFVFTIKPPIWKTTWFIILSTILGIVMIYAFINYRIKMLKRDKDILEKEVVKRTAEITMQKEEIEAQRDEIEAQRNHVVEQRDRIEIQNKDITSSIHYASRIQRAVLPPQENFKEFLNEYFIFFIPRDIVSGDFYYLNKKDDRVIVAAADCTGHGVPGAFMSLLGVALLNQIVSELPANYNAAMLLNSLREGIKKALRQTGKKDEAKDGMDISLCVIDKKNFKLEFAGAFNPLLVVRNNELLIYKADKMPIGVYISDELNFTNHTVELQKDDMIYLYSDGFQDQFGGPNRRKFLPKNLRNLLHEISNLSMEQQKEAIDKVFHDWKGNEHQIDDILVMGIKV
jgi:serine phosphatase RsbU (regulator of sigma subunit)